MTIEHIDVEGFDEEESIYGAMIGYPKVKDYENFRYNAQEGLIKFGGSFSHMLGHTLARADDCNTFKILKNWKEDCEHHANLMIKLRSKNRETTGENNE